MTSRKLHTRPDDVAVDALRERVALEHAAVLELEQVVAVRLGLLVQLLDLGDERVGIAQLVEHRCERVAVVARLEHVVGMRHISAKRLLKLVIRPSPSTTRMPSAVDSSVAASTEFASRSSASAATRSVMSCPVDDEPVDRRVVEQVGERERERDGRRRRRGGSARRSSPARVREPGAIVCTSRSAASSTAWSARRRASASGRCFEPLLVEAEHAA